ncbi:ribosomal L1 domain-containing protein 1 [Trichonephila inaurata madagascariensis]|uniref:Ribosomal L1 domain-containing protein 1 n=1 Tax=Trichonephila inaurata madagascariensis TaxID=2747483 RepID=A0A8X6Y3F4_9ARAC|nr:ribosomal L1 domain-containing protein 1 [Trichonephila inaurata madagascariensis]
MPDKSKKSDASSKKRIPIIQVKKAITILRILNEKVQNELKKKPLLVDASESPVFLQITLKKIPPKQLLQMIKIQLPHSLITDTTEVCLITGDLEKRNHKAESEPVIMHYKDLLRKHGITKITEVIPLRQLRTEYKTFESKRHLAHAYDVFLADKRIACYLPKLLGKEFFKKRKFPIQIDMTNPYLEDEIEKALYQAQLAVSCRGNSYAFEVARLSMEDIDILENIVASVERLANKLPGKWDNVNGLYIKTEKSKAIPIYISYENPNDVVIPIMHKTLEVVEGELSTIPDDKKVKVYADGNVEVLDM